jgi:hypothetical protein
MASAINTSAAAIPPKNPEEDRNPKPESNADVAVWHPVPKHKLGQIDE